MKKVRVLKEMPFADVGEIWEIGEENGVEVVDGNCAGLYKGIASIELANEFIKEGWLEWVEEPKSLENKILGYWHDPSINHNRREVDDLLEIVNKHYLEVFDKADKDYEGCTHSDYRKYWIGFIRKALEDA